MLSELCLQLRARFWVDWWYELTFAEPKKISNNPMLFGWPKKNTTELVKKVDGK